MVYKIDLITNFRHKVFKISSSLIIFHNELCQIKYVMQKIMHLIRITDNEIKKFLDKQNNKGDIYLLYARTVFQVTVFWTFSPYNYNQT